MSGAESSAYQSEAVQVSLSAHREEETPETGGSRYPRYPHDAQGVKIRLLLCSLRERGMKRSKAVLMRRRGGPRACASV